MSKGIKVVVVVVVVLSYAMAFFFSWFMNSLVHTYIPSNVAEWVEDAVSALMIIMLLWAVGFFDRFGHK